MVKSFDKLIKLQNLANSFFNSSESSSTLLTFSVSHHLLPLQHSLQLRPVDWIKLESPWLQSICMAFLVSSPTLHWEASLFCFSSLFAISVWKFKTYLEYKDFVTSSVPLPDKSASFTFHLVLQNLRFADYVQNEWSAA